LVLLPIKKDETDESPAAYRAPLRQALIDDNTGHVNIVVSFFFPFEYGRTYFAANSRTL